MKPLGGTRTPTRRLTRGCTDAKGCPICGQCTSWSSRLSKCRACYTWPLHCLCAARGMDLKAQSINQATDVPMYDRNNANGVVQFHNDPSKMYDHIANSADVTIESSE